MSSSWKAVLLTTLLPWGAVHAQDAAIDPPDRVARVSYVYGDVTLMPDGVATWQKAPLNRPLTMGDRLATAGESLVEIDLGTSALRLGGTGDVTLQAMDDTHTQLALTRGALNVSVRSLTPGASIEIDTSFVAVLIDRPGHYHLQAGDQKTALAVVDGNAQAWGTGSVPMPLKAGQRYVFSDQTLAAVTVAGLPPPNAFDRWSASRDLRYNAPASTQYVSQDLVGYQDLDNYGDWQTDPELGAVWYPHDLAADWAPYNDGDWAWIAPWGWSWVDAEPWGFAPFHYGRWSHRQRGWAWVPGPRHLHTVYAPAQVAFVGNDHDRPRPLGAGVTGWLALGPGEVYRPWYRASRGYFNRVNDTNVHLRPGDRLDDHYNAWFRGDAPGLDALGNRGAPRAIASLPTSSFPEIRAMHRAAAGPAFADDNLRVLAHAPPAPAYARNVGTGPRQLAVMRIPTRGDSVVQSAPPATRDSVSARPGLSFIAPEPRNAQAPSPPHFVDAGDNRPPAATGGFQVRSDRSEVRSYAGSFDGAQPRLQYMRTPIDRPRDNDGDRDHGRPPPRDNGTSMRITPHAVPPGSPGRVETAPSRPSRSDGPGHGSDGHSGR